MSNNFYGLSLLRDQYNNFFDESPEDIKKLYEDIYEEPIELNTVIEFLKINSNECIRNKEQRYILSEDESSIRN